MYHNSILCRWDDYWSPPVRPPGVMSRGGMRRIPGKDGVLLTVTALLLLFLNLTGTQSGLFPPANYSRLFLK